MRKLLVLVVGVGLVAGACASEGATAAAGASSSAAVTTRKPTRVPAAPSAGCRAARPAVAAGETKQTITSGGHSRWWYRHVPPAHDGSTPVPLVMDLHGYSEGATVHAALTELGQFGDEHGFVTVTPQGRGPVPDWDDKLGSADLTFIGKVLDTTEHQLCIDANRVYVTGLSDGAFMASAVACQFSTRIAAVAPVAGVRNIKGCAPKRAVPIVAFHGTADGFVAYQGGLGEKALDLPAPDGSGKTLREVATAAQLKAASSGKDSIPRIMAAWAKRNGCASRDTPTKLAPDVTKLMWNCAPADAAVLYRVTGGGHAWPGSALSAAVGSIVGHTTMSIDANEIMWKFFVAHPLAAAK